LCETASSDYAERTEMNVKAADATLIISPRPLSGGTRLTVQFAERHAKPWLAVDPRAEPDALDRVGAWLAEHRVQVLNVAGPRASKTPDHYRIAYDFLTDLLREESR
jgi:hypothetical protein